MTRSVTRRLLVAVAAVGTLAACSSGGSHTTPSPATGTKAASTTPSTPSLPGLTQAEATSALLTAAQVGDGLTRTTPFDDTSAFPCTPDKPALPKQVPAPVHAVVTYTDELDDFTLTEWIDNYGSAATAARALTVIKQGYNCQSGTFNAIPVTVGAPVDLSKKLTVDLDSSTAWEITASRAQDTYVITKMGSQVVTLIFAEGTGSTIGNIDSAGILQKALTKVQLASQ